MGRDKDGNANGAYSLDGLDDHIQVPNSASPTSFIQNTGIFTISAWIKLDDLNKRAAIVSTSGTRVYKGFGLMYETFGQGFGDHQLRFSTTDGSNHYFQSLGASNTINDLNWHHVLVTGDGQEIRFYVDGRSDGTPTPITRFSTGDTDKPILIGTFIGVDDNRHAHLGGSIDDLMIFDRTLTQAEISQLAQKKTPEEIDQNTSNRQQLAFGQYYRWGFQGQFAEEDEETGWNAFELRMYDPVIGRWLVPDPYNQYPSPYIGMGNNPINREDPDGGFDEPKNGWQRFWNSITGRGYLNTSYDLFTSFNEQGENASRIIADDFVEVLVFDQEDNLQELVHFDEFNADGVVVDPTDLLSFLNVYDPTIGIGPDVSPGGRIVNTSKWLYQTSKGVWKWKINGRIASEATLKRLGLLKPKLNTTTKVSKLSKDFEKTITGVPSNTGPLSHWEKFKQIIRILGASGPF